MDIDESHVADIIDIYPGDIGIYRLDAGRLATLYSVPDSARRCGMTEDGFRSLTLHDALAAVVPSDRALATAALGSLSETGRSECSLRVVHGSDGFIWVNVTARIIGRMKGDAVVLAVFQSPSASDTEHSALLDQVDDVVYVVGKDTYELFYANRAALRSWGCEVLTDKPCFSFVNGFDAPCPWCSIPLMEDGRCHADDAQVPGTDIWMDIDCHETEWYGRPAVIVMCSDVSQRHRRQRDLETDRDDLKSVLVELSRSRQMYEAAVEEAKLVVWEYDIPNARIIMSNNDFTEYDYRKFELPKVIEGAPDSLIPYIDDESTGAFLDMYDKVRSGAPRASCEVWYKLVKDREPRCEHISYTTVFDEDGNAVWAYGIGQNITAQKLDEEKHARMYDDLAKANPNSLGTFRLNLTRNICADGHSPYPQVLQQQASGTVDGYLDAIACSIADEAIRGRFREMFSRERLIESFKEGVPQLSIRYPTEFSDGSLHWLDGFMAMAMNPSTGDVEAVTYSMDATARVLDRSITSYITDHGYDFIGFVDAHSGRFEARSIGSDACEGVLAPGDYSLFIGRLEDRCAIDDDEETFAAVSNLQRLIAAIEDGEFSIAYACERGGEPLRKQIRFGWLDASRRTIIVAQTDVTVAYRREKERVDELESRRRALVSANALLHGVLDSVPSAVFWKDDDRRFEGANRAFLDFYGFASIDDIRGRNDEDMGWHPDPGPYRDDELRVLRDGVSTHRVPGLCESHGSIRHIVASKSPRREDGRIVGLVGSFEDVTSEYEHAEKIAKLNTDLRQALEVAERSAAAEQAFLSNMSHDMRTPLNGIIGFTDLARHTDDPKRRSDYLDKIAASGQLMLDLVNDVLDMSKIESGKMEMRPEPFESRSLMDAVIESVGYFAQERGVELTARMDEDYPRFISADRLRLQQIALNLLSNAIKYTPEGGKVDFDISVVDPPMEGCNTLLRVSDTGIGMSSSFQERMFEPFAQEHQSSVYGMQGTGLGLSIVKRVVSIMGGRIEVESILSQGTVFRIYLPIDIVDIAGGPRSQNRDEDARIEGRRILLCEDNDLNAEIAQTVLTERGGADVVRARDGKEGLETFMASAPGDFDAILMDLRMPVMDGLKTARAIRALDRSDAKDIPIVAMTADAFAEDVRNCLDAGMDGHVAKPIDPVDLIAAIAASLASRDEEDAAAR